MSTTESTTTPAAPFKPFCHDLQALEHFLRGSRPGHGKSLAYLILASLLRHSEGHPTLQGQVGELSRRVQAYVETGAATLSPAKAKERWNRIEDALTACRTRAAGTSRPDLLSSGILT